MPYRGEYGIAEEVRKILKKEEKYELAKEDIATKEALCTEDPRSVEVIKPVLRGKDIKKYYVDRQGLWVINTHNNPLVKIKNYPAIKKHLDRYISHLKKRQDKGVTPYNLRNCAYLEEFSKEKIIWADIRNTSSFAYIKNECYSNDTTNFITSNTTSLKYLIACMNSKLLEYEFKNIGVDLGKSFRWKILYVEQVHIPKISLEEMEPFINYVDRMLAVQELHHQSNSYDKKQYERQINALDQKINKMVYGLYGLDEKEISYLENHALS